MRDKYNTYLQPDQEAAFQDWANKMGKQNDVEDYDLRGFYKDNPGYIHSPDAHMTDLYKKPNHPTFSDQSMYHGVDGNFGGSWGQDMSGKDYFQPSAQQATRFGDLQQYFQEREPNAYLKK